MVRRRTQRTKVVPFYSAQSVECAVVRADVARFVARFGLGPTTAMHLRLQLVVATHWLNRSAGVLKSNVFLGRSLSCRATAFNRF